MIKKLTQKKNGLSRLNSKKGGSRQKPFFQTNFKKIDMRSDMRSDKRSKFGPVTDVRSDIEIGEMS